MSKKILIVEDESAIASLIKYALEKEKFEVRWAENGKDALNYMQTTSFDLILLDLMLPDMNGLDICKSSLRDKSVPLIIITAKSDVIDKVIGLELGADDYVTKPFDVREVVARVKSTLRRLEKTFSNNDQIIIKDIKIHKQQRVVTIKDEKVDLTPKEFQLLLLLAENKDIVFSREQLVEKVWGYDFCGGTRTVDIHVRRLRKKIDDEDREIIETVFGAGYKVKSKF